MSAKTARRTPVWPLIAWNTMALLVAVIGIVADSIPAGLAGVAFAIISHALITYHAITGREP